ncbi:M13-type metalloendopeptidase [Bacillus massiliigorillae]|uniref:M13-type metalloendopeptidase n=1 Tax=Bacillus massiliigorillae TaxID=1243664 RepID=UPI0009DD020A|nr:M13-type metalloendopeptidase [Bacillus massiliigorillae]
MKNHFWTASSFLIIPTHHSSNNVRVNHVLVHFDEFYQTYKIKKDDGMYVAPKDRISIW